MKPITLPMPCTLEAAARVMFMATMREFGCDTLKVAQALGCSRKNVYNLLHRFTGVPRNKCAR